MKLFANKKEKISASEVKELLKRVDKLDENNETLGKGNELKTKSVSFIAIEFAESEVQKLIYNMDSVNQIALLNQYYPLVTFFNLRCYMSGLLDGNLDPDQSDHLLKLLPVDVIYSSKIVHGVTDVYRFVTTNGNGLEVLFPKYKTMFTLFENMGFGEVRCYRPRHSPSFL